MKAPDAALVRARAKAPLADLLVLHLSTADLACLRNLESCRSLRSLYANANVVKDIDGLSSLRCLWRIDLSDNRLGDLPLTPLASFPALGFLNLERNQLRFQDLVCLRDVHILDLRLTGNVGLLPTDADRLALLEYRIRVVALLPSVWTLDGHFVTTTDRAQALESGDDWVLSLLHSDGTALRFGSTSDVWGASGDLTTPVQQETLTLFQLLEKQPTRSHEQHDFFRLRALVAFYDRESDVHNAHVQFAPQRHAATAKPMATLRLQRLVALPSRVRLELSVLLATAIDYNLPPALVTEALTVAALQTSLDAVEELVRLPRYVTVACVSALRQQALEEQDDDVAVWSAMPSVLPTLFQSARDAADARCLERCAFAVSLLARAASFPSKLVPSSDLYELVETAKRAPTAALERLGVAIPSVLVGDSSSSDMPWKKKSASQPERDYRKPWSERPSLVASASSPDITTTPLTRRRPKVGEWLEVAPRVFFKIRTVTPDGAMLTASPASAADASVVALRIDDVARVSSSMWRLTQEDPLVGDELRRALTQAPTPNRLGKLHRAPESFHKHGAARDQGYPNRDIAPSDLEPIEPTTTTLQPPAVEVFSAADTLDANYVLTTPALISFQNAAASKAFEAQRRAPAGLWSPIETASFRVTSAAPMTTTTAAEISVKPKKTPQRVLSRPQQAETADDWRALQRDMQALLGRGGDVACFVTAVPLRDEDERDDEEQDRDDSEIALPSSPSRSLASFTPGTAERATPKPRKLVALPWRHVPTKPELLVAPSPSPSPLPGAVAMAVPRQRSDSGGGTVRGSGGTETAPVAEAFAPRARIAMQLSRCHVSLPSLSLVAQK